MRSRSRRHRRHNTRLPRISSRTRNRHRRIRHRRQSRATRPRSIPNRRRTNRNLSTKALKPLRPLARRSRWPSTTRLQQCAGTRHRHSRSIRLSGWAVTGTGKTGCGSGLAVGGWLRPQCSTCGPSRTTSTAEPRSSTCPGTGADMTSLSDRLRRTFTSRFLRRGLEFITPGRWVPTVSSSPLPRALEPASLSRRRWAPRLLWW